MTAGGYGRGCDEHDVREESEVTRKLERMARGWRCGLVRMHS